LGSYIALPQPLAVIRGREGEGKGWEWGRGKEGGTDRERKGWKGEQNGEIS